MTNRDAGATTPGDSTHAADTYEGDNVRVGVDYVQTGPARNLHPVAPDDAATDHTDQARDDQPATDG
jgi:hypothetical protein